MTKLRYTPSTQPLRDCRQSLCPFGVFSGERFGFVTAPNLTDCDIGTCYCSPHSGSVVSSIRENINLAIEQLTQTF